MGKVIAILLEEGDSIDSIVLPTNPPASPAPSTPPPTSPSAPVPAPAPKPIESYHPTHSRPLSPAVARLLALHKISNPGEITASGKHGMLTKGDILKFLNGGTVGSANSNLAKERPVVDAQITESTNILVQSTETTSMAPVSTSCSLLFHSGQLIFDER